MTALLLLAVLALVLLNGFFVVAEYALVRSRRSRLEADREQGLRNSALVLTQLEEIDTYISAAQVGITFTSIGIGAVGEPAVADLLNPLFGNVASHAVATVIAGLLAYLLITSAHITVGEIVPKYYAYGHAEGVARRVARPLRLWRSVVSPFSNALTWVSHRILRLMGVDAQSLTEEGGTPDELKALIAESYTGGHLDEGEAGMLSGVFHLHEQEARQVMTPIPAVITVDVSETVETALRRCISAGHTRLIVTEENNPDRVKGLVHANALARILLAEGAEAPFADVIYDAPIVPETKPLDDLLADLQRARTEMAIVVDEYGRTAGIVTVEDILEEIVGEIDDETDPAGGAVRQLGNGDWFVRGHVAVDDLKDYGLDFEVGTDAYNSVGGFVFAQLGRLPARGDTITADGYSIRVESVRDNRIEAVRIRRRGAATAR